MKYTMTLSSTGLFLMLVSCKLYCPPLGSTDIKEVEKIKELSDKIPFQEVAPKITAIADNIRYKIYVDKTAAQPRGRKQRQAATEMPLTEQSDILVSTLRDINEWPNKKKQEFQ